MESKMTKIYSENPKLNFKDISTELYRVYVFPALRDGEKNVEYRIEEPDVASFKAPTVWCGGGSHRVVDRSGKAHYIPSGWIAMYWEKPDGVYPFLW